MNIAPDYAFTFTSFDDGVHPGGWQVKDEWTPPDAYARESLLAGIRTDLGTWDLVPQFPTKAQRLQLPLRLEHRTLPDGRSAVWNSIAAGPDASGRPGNVFVTGLVLSSRNAATHRAIDLWRSSSLPEPFGPREVEAALCPPRPLLNAGKVSAEESVTKFLLPDYPAPDRSPLLLVLLDAVAEAVRGQSPGINLIVEDCDEGAAWIASICALASPAWSARFTWSTWETPQSLNEKSVQALHLVAVPSGKGGLPELGRHRLNVDVRAELQGLAGTGHVFSPETAVWAIGGREVAMGDWSRLAKTVVDVEPDALTATLLALRTEVGPSAANDPTEGLRRLRGEPVDSVPPVAVMQSTPAPTVELPPPPVPLASQVPGRPAASNLQQPLPAPNNWRETVKFLSVDHRTWIRQQDGDDSPACESARGALAGLGLDPNGGFVNPDFLAIISAHPGARETIQQLVMLAVHATGGRAPQRWEAGTESNLLRGLSLLDESLEGNQLRCRYLAEACLASVRLDLDGHGSATWERRFDLLMRMFYLCQALSMEDVWSRVAAWQEGADATQTARWVFKGEAD